MAGPKNKMMKARVETAKMSLQKQSHKGASSYPLNQSFNRLTVLARAPNLHAWTLRLN